MTVLLALQGAMTGRTEEKPTPRLHTEARLTHPISLSSDGTQLVTVNPADARISIFAVSLSNPSYPVLVHEIPVGLEPVSVRHDAHGRIWVVCELSDSVHVISSRTGLVEAVLPCSDEPSDVMLANGKAYVSCARNRMVRVFDTVTLEEKSQIPLEMHGAHQIALSPDGQTLFVAARDSGNGTTTLPASQAPPPPSPLNPLLPPAPRTGLIVDRSDPRVPYKILDRDIALIDTSRDRVLGYWEGLMTSALGISMDETGDLWASGTSARNLIRFEPQLKGHFIVNELIRVRSTNGVVDRWNLDGWKVSDSDGTTSLAQPYFTALSPSHPHRLWIAGFGSDQIAAWSVTSQTPDFLLDVRVAAEKTALMAPRSPEGMRGPRGLVEHPQFPVLYVYNKLSQTISVVDVERRKVVRELPCGSQGESPSTHRRGRELIHDARLSAGQSSSCASCHLDADRDFLAWDLGDPTGSLVTVIGANLAVHDVTPLPRVLHPMKGPMLTQSLRGIPSDRSLHWRGDRLTIHEFGLSFRDLLGGEAAAREDMDAVGAYLSSLKNHPNPHRGLEGSLPATLMNGNPTRGQTLFNAHINHCGVCHTQPEGSDFNIDDLRNFGGTQPIMTPSLQTLYQRLLLDTRPGSTNIVGFGLGHDGSVGKLFLPTVHFYELDILAGQDFKDVTAFIAAFDSGTAPIVGHTIHVTSQRRDQAVQRQILLMQAQADLGKCDLIVRGLKQGHAFNGAYASESRGFVAGATAAATPVSYLTLLAELIEGDYLEFLCLFPNQASLYVLDRNQNGLPDDQESITQFTAIAQGQEEILIRWMQPSLGWVLESTENIHSEWTLVNRTMEVLGENSLQTIISSDNPIRFFRLRRTW